MPVACVAKSLLNIIYICEFIYISYNYITIQITPNTPPAPTPFTHTNALVKAGHMVISVALKPPICGTACCARRFITWSLAKPVFAKAQARLAISEGCLRARRGDLGLRYTMRYIWHSPGHPHPPPRGWSWFPAPPPVGVGGVVVDGWQCWLMES